MILIVVTVVSTTERFYLSTKQGSWFQRHRGPAAASRESVDLGEIADQAVQAVTGWW